ncbi:MAG: hypothetical protein ACLFVA_04455 [Dehalococcoidia bacterium]
MLFLLVMVIMYFGALISFFLAVGMVPLALASLAAIPLILLLVWRIIYPWLVRMGRWSAQVANIIFLALVLTAAGIGLGYLLGAPTITLLGIELPATVLIFGLLFLFLLLLGLVVWLVRIWRYTWPISRNLFWDLLFRIFALFWRILVGIPLGVVWFLSHPPLRWLVATLLFYLRGISAGVAWALYNPPLRSIAVVLLLISRFIGRIISWIIYNPPISWVIGFGLFILRLMARFFSAIIYAIWSWWPTKGVRRTLDKGLNVEKKSYQQYGYAQNDGSGAA